MSQNIIHIFGGGTVSHIRNHLAICAPAYGTTANKGQPMVMLHLEWHKASPPPYFSFGWNLREEKPEKLLDSEVIFRKIDPGVKSFDLSHYDGKSFIDKSAVSKPSEWWKVWQKNV